MKRLFTKMLQNFVENTRYKRLLLTALNTSVCWLSIHLLVGIFQVRENLAKNEKVWKIRKKNLKMKQKIYKFQVFINGTEHI